MQLSIIIRVTGHSSEAKKKGRPNALQARSVLGQNAISNKKFFTKAKVYGNVLQAEGAVRLAFTYMYSPSSLPSCNQGLA
jgi:hypothetical protein